MPPLKQKSKRKASELVKESAKPAVVQESESDYESDEVFQVFFWLCDFSCVSNILGKLTGRDQ